MAETQAAQGKPKSKSGSWGGRLVRALFGKGRLWALLLLAALMAIRVADPYPVEFLRLKTFDFYQKTKPREVTERPVVIIDLDENSLQEVGQWPWPRTVVARMVANLMNMGAALVAFDVVFPESDRMSPANIADSLFGLDKAMIEHLKTLPSNDQILADVIAQSRVVLGQAGFWDEKEDDGRPTVKRSIAIMGPSFDNIERNLAFLPNFRSLIRNVPEIEGVAAGHGIFSLVPEPDGIVRRVPTLFNFEGDLYPALSIEMLRVATGRPTIVVRTNDAGIDQIAIARGLTISTDPHGRVWPYFSKTDWAKYVSARDVLSGNVDPARINGRLALVGTSAVGLLDIRATPTEPVMPGVEVHAQMIETAIEQNYLQRPNYLDAAELMLLLVGGLLVIWLVPVIGAKWTLLLFAVIAGGSMAGSWHLFTTELMLFDAGFAVISLLFLYTLLTYTGYASEEAQRQRVRNAFGHYLSPAMVERLASNPEQLTLGGETRNMTMLFCDVRGFTSISELFDAQGLTQLINKLLTPLTKIILDRQGTVDKYMGDCIMAFWNAPLDDDRHARHACLSALEMLAAMQPLNDKLEQEAKDEGRKHIPLKVGIGLNSGDVVVGNMGSDQRFDYSVLGDNVNLASRLEGQCKTYHVDIVIGENSYVQAQDLACLELDLIKVKGKSEAVRIYVLLGDEEAAKGQAFTALKAAHDAMLAAYRAQDWDGAEADLARARKLALDAEYKLDEFYDLYVERIAEYRAHPPGADWDGVFVATSK